MDTEDNQNVMCSCESLHVDSSERESREISKVLMIWIIVILLFCWGVGEIVDNLFIL